MDQADERPTLGGLLLAALVLSAALLPPELSGPGLSLAATLAAGIGILLLYPRGEEPPRVPRGRLLAAGAVSAYLILAFGISSQPHRTLSVLLGAGIAAVAFVAALRLPVPGRARERVLWTLAVAGGTVAGWGVYQRLFGLAQTARRLRELARPSLDPAILRAESGRAFGGFLLPSSLGIFLAMAIPLTLRFAILHRWRGKKGLAAAGLLFLQAAGLLASASYGAVVSLAAASLLLFGVSPVVRRRSWILWSAAGSAVAAGAMVLASRSGEGTTPLILRAGNWIAACRIFLSAPLFGVGPGNFADAYPRVLVAGMNETAYAHNSYLQVAAEGGILGLLWAVWGAGLLVTRLLGGRGLRRQPAANLLLGVAPLAFLVHNLFDFSAYLPSLSIAFAVTAGAAVRQAREGRGGGSEDLRDRSLLPRAALVLLLLGGTGWALREAWSRRALEAGREQVAAGRIEAGTKLLELAARRDPSDPDPPALLAEVFLTEAAGNPALRSEGERYARLSVDLRPRRAYGHYVLALYRLDAGDRGGAWTEIQRARELFPARNLYLQEERRLRQAVASGAGAGVGTDVGR